MRARVGYCDVGKCAEPATYLATHTPPPPSQKIDTFAHPKTGRTSNCYRVTYRSMDRSLTDEEINALQETLREDAAAKLGVELR